MKIVFTAKGSNWASKIDPRFGRMDVMLTYDEIKDELIALPNNKAESTGHGIGSQIAKKVLELNPNVIITGNGPGRKALDILQNSDVEIYIGAANMSVKEAYEAFKNNRLEKF